MVKKMVFIMLSFFLISSSMVFSAEKDPQPFNLTGQSAFYHYQDWTGVYTGPGYSPNDFIPPAAKSGAYFMLDIMVKLNTAANTKLTSFNQVNSVIAKHLDTKREINLVMNDSCSFFNGLNLQEWFLFIRPDKWMFDGDWRFIMLYDGNDGKQYRQTVDVTPFRAFPLPPSHVQIIKSDASITISWSAIGDPHTGLFDYAILGFDNNLCFMERYYGNWMGSGVTYTGTYDPTLNMLTFNVPIARSGSIIRVENRIVDVGITPHITSRAVKFITLP